MKTLDASPCSRGLVLAALTIFALNGAAFGQLVVVTSATPGAAKPGDEVVLRGTGFLNATHVRFTANVGGAIGLTPQIVAVNPTSDTLLRVIMPAFNAFTFPPASPAGSALGFFEVRDAGGLFSAAQNIYYLEGDHDGATTIGLGSTNTSTFRGASSFDLAGGPPFSGNNSFAFTGENLTPTSVSFVIIGFPVAGPIPVLDGLLSFDPLLPYGVAASVNSDASGLASVPAPVPGGMFGVTFTLSWIYVDSISFAVHITNGLSFTI